LKIWIDILTPKQLVFAEPIIERLGKKHKILRTSRDYDEVSKLAKVRRFSLVNVGKHGGGSNLGKLESSVSRMQRLTKKIKTFKPEMVISFCSPEAARISFGLGIKHIAFCDAPHAEAVMKLTLPLIQKLLIPSFIPKKEFAKFGISERDIIPYKAIDGYVTIKRKAKDKKTPFKKNNKKNILIRMEEEEAAYTSRSSKIIPIIKKIIEEFENENIVILGRYTDQISNLRKVVGNKVKVTKMEFDGKNILENTDVFVGSGGTMTVESALLGIPTISYSAAPNVNENYLAKRHIVIIETEPQKVANNIKKMLENTNKDYRRRAKKILSEMEDPIQKLDKLIRNL